MKKLVAFLLFLLVPSLAFAITPTVTDTLDVTTQSVAGGSTSSSISYTVPATGTNKVTWVLWSLNTGGTAPTVTLNGTSGTCTSKTSAGQRTSNQGYCYILNPTTGTLTLSFSAAFGVWYAFTTQDAFQGDADASIYGFSATNVTTASTTVTTTQGNDLGVDFVVGYGGASAYTWTHGANQTEIASTYTTCVASAGCSTQPAPGWTTGTYKASGLGAGGIGMREDQSPASSYDMLVVAIKLAAATVPSPNPTVFFSFQ